MVKTKKIDVQFTMDYGVTKKGSLHEMWVALTYNRAKTHIKAAKLVDREDGTVYYDGPLTQDLLGEVESVQSVEIPLFSKEPLNKDYDGYIDDVWEEDEFISDEFIFISEDGASEEKDYWLSATGDCMTIECILPGYPTTMCFFEVEQVKAPAGTLIPLENIIGIEGRYEKIIFFLDDDVYSHYTDEFGD